jgi:hypothetical protein
MWPYFGRFTDDRDVKMAQGKTLSRGKLNSMGQKTVGTGPFPLSVTGGKMVANITECGSAQYCIGQRMERNIGVAMPGKPFVMRDLKPAQP